MSSADGVEGGLVRVADLLREPAPFRKDAAGERRAELRQVAGDRVEPVPILAQAASRNAAQEADRVRVPRLGEHRLRFPLFDQAPGVQDSDPLAHPPDHAEVVADEEDARAELLPQCGDEVEHLRLDGRVEPGRRLVEDQQRRIGGQGHRDHDSLLPASGELVRVESHPPGRVGDLDLAEHVLRSLERFVLVGAHELEDLRDLRADADGRVQRRAGVLVHHRDRRRTQAAHLRCAHREQVGAVGADRARDDPAVPGQVAHDRERGRGLPAPGLADEPVRLALPDGERQPAQDGPVHAAHPVHDLEILEFDRRLGHRSKVWAIASAIRLMPMISVAMARTGKSTAHHTPALMNV